MVASPCACDFLEWHDSHITEKGGSAGPVLVDARNGFLGAATDFFLDGAVRERRMAGPLLGESDEDGPSSSDDVCPLAVSRAFGASL